MTIAEALAFAKTKKLPLGATRETVPIEALDTPWHGPTVVRPDFVSLLRKNPPWPADLPLIVAACEGLRCAVIDGSHRLEAAQQAGYQVVPIIAVERSAVDALVPYFREDEDALWEHGFPFDEILGVYIKTSPLVRENRDKERAWDRRHA